MGYQPRRKSSPKGAIHEYKKTLHEKSKNRKHTRKLTGGTIQEEKHFATEKEITEVTLKRLHVLGSQKFGSSPFNEHFDRWLIDVAIVLGEFESHPNIGVDDQYVRDRSQTLTVIKQQLEKRSKKESSLDQEITNLTYYKNRLKQINTEYAKIMAVIKKRKKLEIKRLNRSIEQLKKEQDRVIRLKTGFFRGISRKGKEQKEIDIGQKLNVKQRELELIVLAFSVEQKKLREKYEVSREPVVERIKKFQKIYKNLETDGSLEERWFACEELVDSINSFLQRKSTQKPNIS
jgi:hypothetical protein